jgi:hypothetical protein
LLTEEITKTFVISVLNNQNYKNTIDNAFFNSLFNEFEIIRNLIWENPPLDHIKKPSKKEENYKGSFIADMMHEFENNILSESTEDLDSSKIGSLMYDGFIMILMNQYNLLYQN